MPRFRAVTVAALMAVVGCGSSTGYGGNPPPPPPPGVPPPPPPPGGGHSTTIMVNNDFFSPTPDTVSAGTITFSWATPSNGHNVTWLTGPSPTLPENSTPPDKSSGTFQVTLTAGTYTYHCTRHAMSGEIVVQ